MTTSLLGFIFRKTKHSITASFMIMITSIAIFAL